MDDQTSKVYIHYGSQKFNKDIFKPIKNNDGWTKPIGGFWASPICVEFGWKDWCESENFKEYPESCCFTFTLPEANILYISNVENLKDLPTKGSDHWWTCLDFEKLMKSGYDAVEVNISSDRRLYNVLYRWDCDSILVMNPDVMTIPDKRPVLSYDGPLEQTAGYKCPVYGGYTDPYKLDDENECNHCGYILNLGWKGDRNGKKIQ